MENNFLSAFNLLFKDGNCKIFYIENPSKSLPKKYQEALTGELIKPSSDGFGHQVSFDSLSRHLFEKINYLVLATIFDKPFGFLSAQNISFEKMVYLSGIVISPDSQNKGTGSMMMNFLTTLTDCNLLSLTTQSPRIYSMLKRISKKIYPNEYAIVPEKLQQIGNEIMQDR